MPNSKLKQYLQIKSDPALALMRMMKDHEKEMGEYMEKCEKDMAEMIKEQVEEKINKLKEGDILNATFIEKLINKAVGDILRNLKGDPGYTPIKDKDYFDGYTPIKGRDYFDGITPIAGKDYPTTEQIWQEIKKQIAKIEIPQPINGQTPIKGVDYFTTKDISEFVNKVKDLINMEEILKKLEEIIKEIANLKKEKQQLGGQRTLHRGGIDLRWNENVGTGNGSTTAFDLDFTPYSSSELQVWVGSGIQFLTDDFTLSGKTITFITRPPDGAVIRATYRRA